jgi:copper chaperone NosL
MRVPLLFAVGLYILAGSAVFGATLSDVSQSPACRHCGMDRATFSHSRMLIAYEDGTAVATCSIHCAAVELANAIDRIPEKLSVADYDSKDLIDAESAVWVMGGGKKGVMTGKAKWAFASREAADRFIKANGGAIAGFDEAIRASYEDMYQDTKMIREFRKMKRIRQH